MQLRPHFECGCGYFLTCMRQAWSVCSYNSKFVRVVQLCVTTIKVCVCGSCRCDRHLRLFVYALNICSASLHFIAAALNDEHPATSWRWSDCQVHDQCRALPCCDSTGTAYIQAVRQRQCSIGRAWGVVFLMRPLSSHHARLCVSTCPSRASMRGRDMWSQKRCVLPVCPAHKGGACLGYLERRVPGVSARARPWWVV